MRKDLNDRLVLVANALEKLDQVRKAFVPTKQALSQFEISVMKEAAVGVFKVVGRKFTPEQSKSIKRLISLGFLAKHNQDLTATDAGKSALNVSITKQARRAAK